MTISKLIYVKKNYQIYSPKILHMCIYALLYMAMWIQKFAEIYLA